MKLVNNTPCSNRLQAHLFVRCAETSNSIFMRFRVRWMMLFIILYFKKVFQITTCVNEWTGADDDFYSVLD